MNAALVAALEEMAELARVQGEPYRQKAYAVAAQSIQSLKYKLDKKNFATMGKLPGIGIGIREKINEWLRRGRIADAAVERKAAEAYVQLSKITGVGPSTVKRWVDMGVDTLPKLRTAVAKGTITLNQMQKYGLRYYVDLNTRIPRREVTAISKVIAGYIKRLDPAAQVETAGSYRRLKDTSGDIDIITAGIFELKGLIATLEQDPNFVDVLSAGPTRVTFLYLGNHVVQIDVLLTDASSYWAAICYFTGPAEHNIQLRTRAKNLGYRLNQNGLFRQTAKATQLISLSGERDLYELLGYQWQPPEQRGLVQLIESPRRTT